MANSNHKAASGLISQAFRVAKKLSSGGLALANHVAPGSTEKLNTATDNGQVVDVVDHHQAVSTHKNYENPQQMFRNHVPKVTQQLLGRHYSKVNNVTSFISPELNNKVADYFFEHLNEFISKQSSVAHLLKEVGAQNLAELAKDPQRSARITHALLNQNKMIALAQGAVTGASGVFGTALDIPMSLALTLRTIYQTGRVHGFELDHAKEQEIVAFVFKQVDLGSIAEKQALLIAVRTIAHVLETQDTQQLQSLLGSSNDGQVLKSWLSNQDGTMKWDWLNRLPNFAMLAKLTPLANAGIGAVYSLKLAQDVSYKAQQIFSIAQQYQIQHPNETLSVLKAYESAQALVAEQTKSALSLTQDLSQSSRGAQQQIENRVIRQVEVKSKSASLDLESPEKCTNKTADDVSTGLQQLVAQHIDVVDNTEQQPVFSKQNVE